MRSRSFGLALFLVLTCLSPVRGASAATPTAAVVPLPCHPVDDVNDRCPVWESAYEGPVGHDMPYGADLTPDGGLLFVAGDSAGEPDSFDGMTAAFSTESGQRLWAARLDSDPAAQASDMLYDTAAGPSGERVFVTGATCGSYLHGWSCDVLVAAYGAHSGELLWTRQLDGAARNLDAGFAVAAGYDGEGREVAYVAARSFATGTDIDTLTLALDGESGDTLWSDRFHGGRGFDGVSDVAVGESGGEQLVVVTGASNGPDHQPSDVVTVAYDARTGRRRWEARYPAGLPQDFGNQLAVAGDRVFVSGVTAPLSGPPQLPDYVVVSYDLDDGTRRFASRYDGGSVDTAVDVAATPDGSAAFVTGMSRSGGYDMTTVAYDGESGEQHWVSRYNGPSGDGDAGVSLAYDAGTQSVFVAGSSFTTGPGYLHAVEAIDATSGEQHWVALHQGPGMRHVAAPSQIRVAGDRVLVSGQVGDVAGLDIDAGVFAYDAR